MLIDYCETTPSDIYRLMSQSVIPRPIAWVVTEQNGVVNVAPFSYFTALSSNPPTLLFSVGHKSDGTPKDTLRNLRETKKCTVCIAAPEQLEQMHLSSKELEVHVSEASHFDIPLVRIADGYAPMIENAPVAFFCDFHSEVALEGSKTIPLIVQITQQYIDDDALTDAARLAIAFEPIARVGKGYARLGETLTPPAIP
jgi:flavin reductase (DIM6/NTAB) family NADH-FMN oxidoreductase RutF